MVPSSEVSLRLPGVKRLVEFGALSLDANALGHALVQLPRILEQFNEREYLLLANLYAHLRPSELLCDRGLLQRNEVEALTDLCDRQLPFSS